MSNESVWQPVMERLRRRLQAGGKVIALGAFMSAKKEALPILSELNITPDVMSTSTAKELIEQACALATKERCGSAIRAGLTKKFLISLLTEVPLAPVTDEEVAAGITKGEADHEAKVAARRDARKADERSKAAGGADAGGSAAGNGGDVDPEDEDEDEDTDPGEDEDEDDSDEDDSDDDSEVTPRPTPSHHQHSGARRAPLTEFARANRGAEAQGRANQHHHHEDTMPDENDEQYEGQHDEDDGDEQQDAPPSRRQRVRAPAPQVVVLQQQQPRVKAPRTAPAVTKSRFVRNNDMVHIFKRIGGGKRAFIGEFTSEDIGNMSLLQFLKDFVDPENAEPSGRTTYECVAVDSSGRELARGSQYVIESAPQEGAQNDAFAQARNALDLVGELREAAEERVRGDSDLMREAKVNALKSGDMNGLMMFMMMNQMMERRGGTDEAAIISKVLDRVQPQQPSMPMMMPQPLPPVQMAPPPNPLSGAMEQLVQASIASMLKPDAPSQSPLQQLKDMMELQALMQKMNGGGGDMLALVKTLLEKQLTVPAKSPEAAGVDSMMLGFEKISTMVKALAPQINAGGIAGSIQGILAQPEAQKAIAGIIGNITGAGAQTPQAPGQQTVQGQVAANQQVAGIPAAPAQPQVTPQMREAANSFRIAQTKEVRAERLLQLIQVMYMSGYQQVIEPVLVAAREGNVGAAQRFLASLIADVNPALVSLDLINATLRMSAAMVGEEGKKMLAALDATEKEAAPASPTPKPGTVETPNATVVPIATAPSHPNHAAYMAQVEALEKETRAEKKPATQPDVPPATVPHQPEVLVKKETVKEVVKEAVKEAAEVQPAPTPAPTSTPPAEVVQFEKPAVQAAQPTAT